MIYPLVQRTLVVSCDRCGGELLTNAANGRIAEETAQRNGWWVFDGRHFCPKCAKRLSAADRADEEATA
jgi:hypothetical protein